MAKIENDSVFKISYGLFLLTAEENGKDNGCILNTVQQVTQNPLKISVTVNKENYTHDMVKRTGVFNVSVLTESTPFQIFEQFGFKSGRDADKFDGFHDAERSENGIYYLTRYSNAVISAKVTDELDCGTHTIFVGEITEAKILSDEKSVTYQYYFDNIKPKPQPKKTGYVCKICGYVYEGEPLPEDFVCPWCKHPASDFEKME